MSIDQQREAIRPISYIKRKEAEEYTIVEKAWKYNLYGYECLEILQWGRCKFLHDPLLNKAIHTTMEEEFDPVKLSKELDTSEEVLIAYRAAIRFAPMK